jgi:hypothetical protein
MEETFQLGESSENHDFENSYQVLHSTQNHLRKKRPHVYGWIHSYRERVLSGDIIVFYIRRIDSVLGAISAQKLDTKRAHIGYLHAVSKKIWIGSHLLWVLSGHLLKNWLVEMSLVCEEDSDAYGFYKKMEFQDITESEWRKIWVDISNQTMLMRDMWKRIAER